MPFSVDNAFIEKALTYNARCGTLTSTPTTLNGTLVLTVDSTTVQEITGTATGYSVRLPNATTLALGWVYEIWNISTQAISIRYNDTSLFYTLPPSTMLMLKARDISTSNGGWRYYAANVASIADGLIYKEASASASTTTTSPTYEDLNAMTVTPDVTGRYLVLANIVTRNSNNGQSGYFIINNNGVDDTNSERYCTTSGGAADVIVLQKVINVTAGNIVKIRWRRTANTQTALNRTITALRVG